MQYKLSLCLSMTHAVNLLPWSVRTDVLLITGTTRRRSQKSIPTDGIMVSSVRIQISERSKHQVLTLTQCAMVDHT